MVDGSKTLGLKGTDGNDCRGSMHLLSSGGQDRCLAGEYTTCRHCQRVSGLCKEESLYSSKAEMSIFEIEKALLAFSVPTLRDTALSSSRLFAPIWIM